MKIALRRGADYAEWRRDRGDGRVASRAANAADAGVSDGGGIKIEVALKIIFLDFDGVLNVDTALADDSQELWTASWLLPDLVSRLGALVKSAGAQVVVSSSWRQRRTLEELREILAHHGYLGGVFDVTPRHARPPEGESLVRASEISAWLTRHPEVGSYVILDDDQEFGALASRHVRVDPSIGLSDADVARARAILTERAAFPGGWRPLRPEEARAAERELHRELAPGHLLYGRSALALATGSHPDDVAFDVDGLGLCVVHLTWSAESSTVWPVAERVDVLPNVDDH